MSDSSRHSKWVWVSSWNCVLEVFFQCFSSPIYLVRFIYHCGWVSICRMTIVWNAWSGESKIFNWTREYVQGICYLSLILNLKKQQRIFEQLLGLYCFYLHLYVMLFLQLKWNRLTITQIILFALQKSVPGNSFWFQDIFVWFFF